MNQKIKQQRFLMFLWPIHTPKELLLGHIVRPGSGSDEKDPDPTGSGYVTLLAMK
jgi:hypothetical protein